MTDRLLIVCMKNRGLEPADLIDGEVMVRAPTIINEISGAKKVVGY